MTLNSLRPGHGVKAAPGSAQSSRKDNATLLELVLLISENEFGLTGSSTTLLAPVLSLSRPCPPGVFGWATGRTGVVGAATTPASLPSARFNR